MKFFIIFSLVLSLVVLNAYSAPADFEEGPLEQEGGLRVKRFTCDVLNSESACRFHCALLRKHRAYCNRRRICVLCEQLFEWMPSSGSNIPKGAIEGGRTSEEETLYIGRACHEGSKTVGKVHPSHGHLYIPFDGEGHPKGHYEILVLKQ